MRVKVLVGCELGQNRGHVARALSIKDGLERKGYEVILAMPARFSRFLEPGRHKLAIMPDWKYSIADHRSKHGRRRPVTMTDVLVEVGVAEPGLLSRSIGRWLEVLFKVSPDVVIADYAPGLLLAARGRVPSIAVGTGFTCPPLFEGGFPHLTGGEPGFAEPNILSLINEELGSRSIPGVACVSSLLVADRTVLTTFPELDPYGIQRVSGCYAPHVSMSTDEGADRDSDEIFVYSYRTVPAKSPFWAALSTASCPVRVFMDNPSPEHLAQWAVAGHIVESQPLAFEQIARQAKMVVCHGGHGFISSSMMAGLPTCAVYFDLEKRLNGEAVVRTGTGSAVNLFGITSSEIANAIHAVCNDGIYAQRAKIISNEIGGRQYASFLSALESAWYSL